VICLILYVLENLFFLCTDEYEKSAFGPTAATATVTGSPTSQLIPELKV